MHRHGVEHTKDRNKGGNLPLLSAAPPFMIRATRMAPVCLSRLIVAPYKPIKENHLKLDELHCIFTLLKAALLKM